jgi:hypothetical protein
MSTGGVPSWGESLGQPGSFPGPVCFCSSRHTIHLNTIFCPQVEFPAGVRAWVSLVFSSSSLLLLFSSHYPFKYVILSTGRIPSWGKILGQPGLVSGSVCCSSSRDTSHLITYFCPQVEFPAGVRAWVSLVLFLVQFAAPLLVTLLGTQTYSENNINVCSVWNTNSSNKSQNTCCIERFERYEKVLVYAPSLTIAHWGLLVNPISSLLGTKPICKLWTK